MTDAIVELVHYDESWPKTFELEKQKLLALIGGDICGSIEHVGSTAIPNMLAKPVIDIMCGVPSLQASKHLIEQLNKLSYCYYPYKADVMHWFCKPKPMHRTHHLHLIPFESTLWHDRLFFRNTLKKNPALAQEYKTLKQALASCFKMDREAYTQGKSEFIQRVLSLRSKT